MKVTQRRTNYIIGVVLINIITLFFTGFIKTNHIRSPNPVNYTVDVLMGSSFFICVHYLGCVIKYTNEKKSIIIMMIVYNTINLIAFSFQQFVSSDKMSVHFLLNLIKIILLICLLIQIFKVKNPVFASSFRLFIGLELFLIIFRSSVVLFVIQHYIPEGMLSFIPLVELFPPLTILFILFKTSTYINNQQQVLTHTIVNTDEPA
jgi:hypothetical protein